MYGSLDGNGQREGASNAEDKDNPAEKTPLIVNGSYKSKVDATSRASEGTGSWFSRLFFGWLTALLVHGNEKKSLDPADLKMVDLPKDCSTDDVTGIFERYWEEELIKVKPSLLRALGKSYGNEYLKAGVLKLAHDLLAFVGPAVLNAMIYYLRDVDAPPSRGLYLTSLVGISQLTMSLCVRHYFFKVRSCNV